MTDLLAPRERPELTTVHVQMRATIPTRINLGAGEFTTLELVKVSTKDASVTFKDFPLDAVHQGWVDLQRARIIEIDSPQRITMIQWFDPEN